MSRPYIDYGEQCLYDITSRIGKKKPKNNHLPTLSSIMLLMLFDIEISKYYRKR